MAKKEETAKTVLERVYNVPLRREYMKVTSWRRAKKAVNALRQFIAKHMKSDNIILGKYVNKELWKHGIKNPPHHVKISAKKDDKGKVMVELAELPAKAKRELEKQEKSKKDKTKKEEAKAKEAKKEEAGKKVVEAEFEEAKKEKEEKAKEIEKEEIKELKKELPKQHAPKKMPQQRFQESHPTAPKSQ
ncbi:MAG: 50S ribosomal protein L31e [Nanoarchaeota archaeon]